MKVESLKLGFCVKKVWKESEKRIKREKTALRVERNGLQANYFLMELFPAVFVLFFISILKWLIMLTMVNTETCLKINFFSILIFSSNPLRTYLILTPNVRGRKTLVA